MSLGAVRANIDLAKAALPTLGEAVDPNGARDMVRAREAVQEYRTRSESAGNALAQAEASAHQIASDLLAEIAPLQTELAAVEARARPLLANAPPSYTTLADHEAARTGDPEALARLEAAEARESTDWHATLDDAARDRASLAEADAEPANDNVADDDTAPAPAWAVAVQRKQTSAADLADDTIVSTAAAGVAGASASLPHLDTIQRSFGRHDVTSVRAQVGRDGAAAAGAIGAEAYAIGDRAAFATAPDVHTAAHEAAHTVQQRAGVSLRGGVGEAGDRHEQEADSVADAVVAGRSAEPILDQIAGQGGSATASVQRKLGETLVPASQYLTGSNARDLADTLARHLGSVDWIQPDPRLPWRRQAAFKRALVEGLVEPLLGSSDPAPHLRKLCHPGNPLTVIDQMRPVQRPSTGKLLEAVEPAGGAVVGPADWRPSIGLAIAQLVEASVIASLRRLGPRWVACADRGMSEEARLDETRSLVPYDALVTSHPIDRIVGRAITGEAVFDFQEDPERAAVASAEPVPAAIRPVNVEWQGDRDPKLWNWVKADPPDANAEEVAAALFAGAEKKDGERRTFLAYLLTPAPPLFGVASSTAIGFAEAKRHAPVDGKDSGPDERVMAVASGVATAEIALHQGTDEVMPVATEDGPKAALRDLVSGNQLQLQYLVGILAPWNLAEPVGHALGFLLGKQGELLAAPDADLAAWLSVFTAQRANLQRVGAGVRQVTDKASELGLADPAAPEAAALRDVLAAYARAAGTSHLADTSRALIDEAAGKQAGLALLAVQGSSRGLDVAMDQLRAGTGTDDALRAGYLRQGAELQEQSVALQSRMLAGESVPAEELDQLTLQADMLALRARVRTASVQLDALEEAARAAGQGLAQELAAAMSADFRGVAPTCAAMRAKINVALTQMDQEMAAPTILPGQQVGEAARRHQRAYDAGPKDPRESLRKAEQTFREIAGNEEFVQFLRHGASLVEWQGFRTACIQVAALVGVGIVAGAAGGLVGDALGGMMARAGAAETITELSVGARLVAGGANIATDAAINVAGQHAVMAPDSSLGQTFAENLLISAGALGILGTLEANAARVTQMERATAGLWQRMKGGAVVVLKEGAAITGHTIMGAALGYASHKIVTGQSQPAPETAREWFLQGASMAVGRYVGQSVEARIQQMRRLGGLGDRLVQRAQDLQELAARVEQKPEAHDALELLNRRHELLVEELRVLESLLGDDAAMGKAKLRRGEVIEMMSELEVQLGGVHASGGADITFHLAGLEELVPGAVWRGSREEIQRAVDSAERQANGTERKIESIRDDRTGTWEVTIDGRRYEIHERGSAMPQTAEEARARKAGGESWSNKQIRDYYNDRNREIASLSEEWAQQGMTAEQRARAAHQARHDMRMTAREMMGNGPQQLELLVRDARKYGDGAGPTFEQLVEQQRSRGKDGDAAYEAIVAGAQSTDRATNERVGRGEDRPPAIDLPPGVTIQGDSVRVLGTGGQEIVVRIKAGDPGQEPLRNPDGTFEIYVDKDAPPEVSMRAVVKQIRDVAETPRQGSNDLDQLYSAAGLAQQHLAEITRSVATELGGRALIPENLKGRARAEEKIATDYQGENARITDLARSSIEFDRPQQVQEAVQRLTGLAEVVRIKDRFAEPVNGYRDVMMNLRMPNGHVVEIQLHLKAILDVKNGPGHALYEEIRTIKARAKAEGRDPTNEEKARIKDLVQEMSSRYDQAFEESQE